MQAYVLRHGETAAPDGLNEAFSTGNRLQDILTDEFVTGRTGNEILAAALAQAASEGIKASIYTHPIGFHGHAAGPTIGLWDRQEGVPGKGDYPLFPMTAHFHRVERPHPGARMGRPGGPHRPRRGRHLRRRDHHLH